MSESDEVPFVYIYLRILSQTTKQTISLIESQKHPIGVWQRSSRHSKRWSRCRVRGRRDGLRCGALGSANMPQSELKNEKQRKKGLNMKFNLLQKQTSRREILRHSATLAGGALLALRASAAGDARQAPSAADLLASMRAKFNAVPLE